ncbi:MAG: ATP-binding protein [Bacteroidota bacterium]|jgi:PAS domain S-box-containing protein|nr:PAS domain S-box protein [Ignavibacteria bacterium]HEX2962476.1 ATP-binding protein [Ignavibacteriales bacterium]MCU7500852.1 PAS domain S-box protein [Ignavibacteria bacterium]MCU7511769.1 PAS domain S-box protein [Ignavibacteria bacterium]MCU7520669.1 PAS domain S-box protein [Ignavibacteria bacterium]
MKKNNGNNPKEDSLRRKAEEKLKKQQNKTESYPSEADGLKLLHELQVHQIELEMINEELRLARDKAEINAGKYLELYDFAPSGYLTLHPDGIISELNFSSAKILGMERSMLIGRNFKFFISAESKPVFDDFFKKVFQSSTKAACELMLHTEDNTSMFVYIEGKISENPPKCSLTMIDITDRRIVEESLKHTLAALEKSNSDLQQFAYAASHDLQEPLRMITNYINLLEKKLKGTLDAQTGKYLEFIIDGAKRMQGLIHGLLLFSRITAQKKEFKPTDLNYIVEDVLKDLELIITESGAEINVSKLPVLNAEPTQMHQLFQNLIANAIKFRGEKNPVIHIIAERRENSLIFCVRDNGIGINPEFLERVFMIFQRLHEREKYAGNGIGLALCKKVVENHGGRIWVESEEGKGAAFYFTIPDK